MPEKSTAPLFRQIVDGLKRDIAAGGLAEHDALPSERVIAEAHDVSRMTARRALEAVEAEGLAYSVDRKGRFVSPKRLQYDLNSMSNFSFDAQAQGIEIEMQHLDSRPTKATAAQAEALSVSVGTALFENTRLFLREGHATFLEHEAVVASRCADALADATPEQQANPSEQRYSTRGATADIVIRMCALDPSEAKLLGLMPYQPGIEQEQLVRDTDGTAFCFNRQVWRGELAQFSARAILREG